MTKHSNRNGLTRETHRHSRVRETTRFSCDLCPTDRNLWSVTYGHTVLQSQAAHRAAHDLALREAVETLVAGFASGEITAEPRFSQNLAHTPRINQTPPLGKVNETGNPLGSTSSTYGQGAFWQEMAKCSAGW